MRSSATIDPWAASAIAAAILFGLVLSGAIMATTGQVAPTTANHSHDDLLKTSDVTGYLLGALSSFGVVLVGASLGLAKVVMAKNTEFALLVEAQATATEALAEHEEWTGKKIEGHSDKIEAVEKELAVIHALATNAARWNKITTGTLALMTKAMRELHAKIDTAA